MIAEVSCLLIGGGFCLLAFMTAAWLDSEDQRAEMGVRTAHDQYRQRNAGTVTDDEVKR